MTIEQHYDDVTRCNRCGFCQAACPIFRATGHEAGVARGRLALLRALAEKRIEWNDDLEEPLFACLLCGACTANCFPAVATADLITDARSEYLDRIGRNRLHRLLFDKILPYPGQLRLAARVGALGKKAGLLTIARALGLLRIFGRDFPEASQIADRIPSRAFRRRVPPGVVEGTGTLRIGYFVGCGTDVMCPEAAEATLRILRKLGKTVEVLDNCCCGLPPLTYGERPAAERLVEKNLRLFNLRQAGTSCKDGEDKFDVIVTDCSSCASFLKKYPTLFSEDDSRHAKAEKFAALVRDLPELVASTDGLSFPKQPEKVIATYHDPCHASRGQGLVAEPREILCAIDGLEFRELPEADWCCGGAGSYALSHYDLSRKVLDRKMDNLQRTGAELLVTSCPACIIHLSYGVRKRGLPVRVCHISELL